MLPLLRIGIAIFLAGAAFEEPLRHYASAVGSPLLSYVPRALGAVCLLVFGLQPIREPRKVFGNTHIGNGKQDAEATLAGVEETGFGSFRDEVLWSGVESHGGRFRLQQREAALLDSAALHERGARVVLGYGHPSYDANGEPVPADALAGFARCCGEVASRPPPSSPSSRFGTSGGRRQGIRLPGV
jgi:hypothetical protein